MYYNLYWIRSLNLKTIEKNKNLVNIVEIKVSIYKTRSTSTTRKETTTKSSVE